MKIELKRMTVRLLGIPVCTAKWTMDAPEPFEAWTCKVCNCDVNNLDQSYTHSHFCSGEQPTEAPQ